LCFSVFSQGVTTTSMASTHWQLNSRQSWNGESKKAKRVVSLLWKLSKTNNSIGTIPNFQTLLQILFFSFAREFFFSKQLIVKTLGCI
jgi:hypothetical protein